MKYKLAFFTFVLFSPTLGFSNTPDVANGNLIPEPELTDYNYANRAPGILVEPYDIIESDSAN